MGVEYDGSRFSGWQVQNGQRTVQGAVQEALSRVADRPVEVACAGRTDAGVHATGQVIHFDTVAQRSARSWVFGANANLPKEVAILWVKEVDDSFHARFSAERRRYRYIIFNRPIRPTFLAGRISWEYRPLDERRMNQAARYLLGEHDFSAYRAVACQAASPVRTVYRLQVTRKGELLYLDVEANAFLHHMVRNMAGVLMAIGAGERSPEWAREVLETGDRRLGGVTAPAQGLYLAGVSYPDRYHLPDSVLPC
ncbi:MAG TPA: tRNA pseudouridine(38-40) synthase TruA [Gammaproteobacteria bacterium]|nr:tRNA pseudouridine(38-40) synthase TruA [Gammaproteobacteria bacterium]